MIIKNNDLELHQERLFSLLKTINKFCLENKIIYTLEGGTLLGSIRHKNLIPWDDDADISMTRDQYNIFKSIIKNNDKIKLIKHLWIPRITFKDMAVDSLIFIDLFIYDKTPVSKLIKKLKIYILLLLQGTMHKKLSDNSSRKKIELFIVKILSLFGRLLPFRLKYFVYHIISSLGSKKSNYYMVYNDTFDRLMYDRNLFLKSKFDNYSKTTIRDEEFNKIEDHDYHLKKLYGNYMKLPPEKDQKPTHFFSKGRI